ncbi:MAG: terpene cyclase/mutase family protein [Planctomycetes bacterium]|nr:terpene cyclase/mutase family protein [Planctomycetota bacterium]
MTRNTTPTITVAFLALASVASFASAQGKPIGPDQKTWDAVTRKAAEFLQSSQDKAGGWSTDKSPGVTGIALTGLLKSGQTTPQDPVGKKALKYIESLVNPEKKHIAGKDPRVQLQNYVTSINVMALIEAKQDAKYKAVIGDAVTFLKKLQWDEEDGKDQKSDFFGGAGYDSKSRPDLSNTQVFLDALKAAGVGADDPALKKALVFVSRCQNLKGEHNDRPWAKLINDGSFIYTAATGGVTKVTDKPLDNGALPGYGSMTYAGIKSMIYCGVSKDDPRIKKAYEWIQANYSVDANAGMPDTRSKWGLYYYYNTMAKSLDALGIDYVVDSKGVKHDWRKDITQALAKRQRPDGSFTNSAANWMEADPNLVTGYALMALSYCRPK